MSLLQLGGATILMASSCDDYSGAQEINCNTSGFFCYQTSYNNITVNYGGFYKKTTSCLNVTTSKLCPQGYYCPNTTDLVQCPAGSFCGAGSVYHTRCPFGQIVCPRSQQSAPDGGKLFLILLGILCVTLLAMHRLAKWKIHSSQHKNKVPLTKTEKKDIKLNENLRSADSDHALVMKRYCHAVDVMFGTSYVYLNDQLGGNYFW